MEEAKGWRELINLENEVGLLVEKNVKEERKYETQGG